MIQSFEEMKSKLNEGNIKTIDNEQNQEDITIAVSTEIPEEANKVEKDDKTDFEEFKIQYKGVIDIKCRQDFGDCEDEKLWEDTAKELFLQSKNYILVGDEYKAKEDLDDHLEKIEESKEIITEDIDEGNSIFEMKFDCSNTDIFGEGEDLYNTVGAKVAEIAEKIKSGRLDGAIMDINGNKIGSYGVGYEGVMSALDESKEVITEDIEIIDINKNNNEPNELTTNVVEELERINFNTKGNAKIRASYVKDNIVKVSVMHNSNNSMVIKIGNAIINRFNTLEDYEIGETYIQPALGGKWGGKALYRIHIICNNDVSDEETPEGALSFKEFEREVKYYDDHNKIDKDEMKTLYYNYYLNNLKLEISELVSDYLNLDESKKLEKSSKTFPLSESSDPEFNYRMLDRLKSDCDYFLGNGNRSEKHLWAGNCEAQIAKMREIYNSLEEKPEWLSEEDIDNYEKEMCSKQDKVEEKRKLPQEEIDQLRKNMRKVLKDHGKFKDDEELEDYIEEFMPMWIEAQENLGTPVTLEESSDEEFKNRYPKSFKAWKEANPNKPDKEIIDILRAMEYNGELYESKQKEIKTEDQYEMERRKGRPNLDKIAKEVFEYDDYYIDVVDNFNTEREFIIEHIAEVASEYNLKEQAAWAVMEKIYRMAKDAKVEKVEESVVSDYTLDELAKVLNSDTDSFKLKVTSLNTSEETKWLNLDKEDLKTLYKAFGGSEKKEETIEGMDIFDPELPENEPNLNNYGGEAQEAIINIENKVKTLSMKELNKIADEAFLEIVYSKKGFMDLVYGSQDKDIIEINNKYFK